jgi:hypothetical protein
MVLGEITMTTNNSECQDKIIEMKPIQQDPELNFLQAYGIIKKRKPSNGTRESISLIN